MEKMWKKIVSVGFVLTLGITSLALVSNMNALTNKVSIQPTQPQSGHQLDFSIRLSNTPMGKASVFTPVFRATNYDTAKIIGGLFAFDQPMSDDADAFYFSDTDRTLQINKKTSQIIYKNSLHTKERTITSFDAKNIAIAFIKDKMLPLYFKECEVYYSKTNKNFNVVFANSLDNKINFGFTKKVTVGNDGIVQCLEYNAVNYTKAEPKKVISMDDAAKLLKQTKLEYDVDIKKVELVYVFRQNQLELAYRFIGEIPSHVGFESFVPAQI